MAFIGDFLELLTLLTPPDRRPPQGPKDPDFGPLPGPGNLPGGSGGGLPWVPTKPQLPLRDGKLAHGQSGGSSTQLSALADFIKFLESNHVIPYRGVPVDPASTLSRESFPFVQPFGFRGGRRRGFDVSGLLGSKGYLN